MFLNILFFSCVCLVVPGVYVIKIIIIYKTLGLEMIFKISNTFSSSKLIEIEMTDKHYHMNDFLSF